MPEVLLPRDSFSLLAALGLFTDDRRKAAELMRVFQYTCTRRKPGQSPCTYGREACRENKLMETPRREEMIRRLEFLDIGLPDSLTGLFSDSLALPRLSCTAATLP